MPSDATKLKDAIRRWSLGVVDDAGERLVQQARSTGEVPRKTGELAGSITASNVVQRGDRYVTGLVVGAPQGKWTDQGTKPHAIRPRRPGGVLRFPSGGAVVFTRRVMHPGTRAQRWFKAFQERRWPNALRAAARSRRL